MSEDERRLARALAALLAPLPVEVVRDRRSRCLRHAAMLLHQAGFSPAYVVDIVQAYVEIRMPGLQH